MAREWHENLFEEKKDKKPQYTAKQYRNFLKKKRKRSINMVVKDIRIF